MHFVKFHSINEFYFLYGFDRTGYREEADYVDYRRFQRRRDVLNRVSAADSPILVLRDKFVFGLVAGALGVRTPQNIGLLKKKELYLLGDPNTRTLSDYLRGVDGDVFVKLLTGECANGIYHLVSNQGHINLDGHEVGDADLDSLFRENLWLLQKRVTQHERLSALYPKAVNTIRLVTVNVGDEIHVLPPLLRVGANGKQVDNWATGGLAVMMDVEHECLGRYGFYKPGYGTKVDRHPNSGLVFEGYRIPFLKEAVASAMRFHAFLPLIHSIGWDIAITNEGPCFIEGNDNWELSLMQVCSHGLQREFQDWFYA